MSLEKIIKNTKISIGRAVATLTIIAMPYLAGCEPFDQEEETPTLNSPWVMITSPEDGATVSSSALSVSYRIMNVTSGETYTAFLRTDNGQGPYDGWIEAEYNLGSFTAKEGTGRVSSYAGWQTNTCPPIAVPSIDKTAVLGIGSERYSGKSVDIGITVKDSKGNEFDAYPYPSVNVE